MNGLLTTVLWPVTADSYAMVYAVQTPKPTASIFYPAKKASSPEKKIGWDGKLKILRILDSRILGKVQSIS
jgi:hypothetical protein